MFVYWKRAYDVSVAAAICLGFVLWLVSVRAQAQTEAQMAETNAERQYVAQQCKGFPKGSEAMMTCIREAMRSSSTSAASAQFRTGNGRKDVGTKDPLLFWSSLLNLEGSGIPNQVADYARRHGLTPISTDAGQHYQISTVLNGVQVYTQDPGDVMCGAPAGALALAGFDFATDADLLSLAETKALLAQRPKDLKSAQETASRKVGEEEAMLRGEQGGYETPAQRRVAEAYNHQLMQSLARSMTKENTLAVMNAYAARVNAGAAHLTQQERCVWAAGILVKADAKSLDAMHARALQHGNAAHSLGFDDGAATSSDAFPFDIDKLKATLSAAQELQHRAFDLGIPKP